MDRCQAAFARTENFSHAEITAELTPLAQVIDKVVRSVPVRLGDTTGLTAALTLAVAGYFGRVVGDIPNQLDKAPAAET